MEGTCESVSDESDGSATIGRKLLKLVKENTAKVMLIREHLDLAVTRWRPCSGARIIRSIATHTLNVYSGKWNILLLLKLLVVPNKGLFWVLDFYSFVRNLKSEL